MGTITRNAANNFTTGGVILPAGINDTSVASITELENTATGGGAMTLISEQTASASASISFTTGIDSTYPIYKFEFINIHGSNDDENLQFNLSTDGGSSYNVTKTTTLFRADNSEAGAGEDLSYDGGRDMAQGTGNANLAYRIGADNDQSCSGIFHLFNPSSSVFVKHFISEFNVNMATDKGLRVFVAGYGNTTSAIDAIKFQMTSGNIDSGVIKLYGISGS
jgi:hypothetical protein